MKLRLTDFDSNTYEDVTGTCELCEFEGMMDHPIYTFTDSDGNGHVVDGWYSSWGDITSYSVNVPVFTYWLHTVEFKEPTELIEEIEEYQWLSGKRFWEEFLTDVLQGAQYCSNEEELNESLDWALKGENNAD